MKKEKKRILLALIFVIFLLIVIIAILIIDLKKENKVQPSSTVEDDKKVIENVKEYYKDVEGQIVPDNYNFLARMYEGNVSSNDIYKAIYMFIFVGIPNINEQLGSNPSDAKILEVYNNNTDIIFSYFGIENEDEFKEFIDKTREIKMENFQNSTFTFDEFKVDDDYTTLDLEIKYETNSLNLKMSIINQTEEGKPSIKFTAQ